MSRPIDLTGQTFGRLTVTGPGPVPRMPDGRALWLCLCSCGASCIGIGQLLRDGRKRSCGCIGTSATKAANTRHGAASRGRVRSEYRIWAGIISRCSNPNVVAFPQYGGRGITVAPEWRHDFPAFLAHVGDRPSPDHGIDRIDNDGNYEPGNVRWATMKEQSRNRRSNRMLTINGETAPLYAWLERNDISRAVYKYRVARGWSRENAASTPRSSRARSP